MSLTKKLCVFLALVTLLCCFPIISVTASATSTVDFSSPAICANTGDTVDLSSYNVEFSDGKAVSADKISWTSEDIAVSLNRVSPAQVGVFKLTATADGKSKAVYLVVKSPSDTEYVLYYDDFSADSLSSYRTVQQTSGAKMSVSDGKLILNANNSGDSYIRLLLPEWIGDFGNYNISTSFTITQTTAKSRWLSVMGRIQNNNYPYWQAAVRQNAKADNGTEIAERTSANKWNVSHKGPYSQDISASKYYELSFHMRDNLAETCVNGTRLLYSNTMTYSTGDVGLQVRGMSASFDYIKVTVSTKDIKGTEHSMTEVRSPKSNIILPPAMVSYVKDNQTLDSIQKSSPAVAVMYVNSALEVTDANGTKIASLKDALAKLDNTVIPAFYIRDKQTISPLAVYLAQNKLSDLYFISDDASILNSARTTYKSSFGILDCIDRSFASRQELLALRDEANACRAKVVVLPENAVTYDNVEFLQRLLMTVWCSPQDSKAGYLGAITAGVNGIVASDRATLENMFTAYFAVNTVIRPANVIGHRGAPSLAQENTIASSVIAYQKGATMIEMDIYLSKDNQIVVMHDDTIDRTTNGSGNTEAFTVAQLQKFSVDANSNFPIQPIPTLEDYFKEFKGKDVQLIIEIKKNASTRIEAALKELVAKYDIADQINVITFSESHMNNMRASLPGVSVGYLTAAIALNETEPLVSLEQVLKKIQPMGTTYNPSYANGALGPNLIREASYRGITLWPYTVNDMAEFNNYFLYGTNGITTNYSQFVLNYTKRLSAPVNEVTVTEDGVDFVLTKTTYGRNASEITYAEAVVVDSQGLDVSYADGKLSAKGNGTATVYFRLECQTSSKQKYYVCSEPVVVKSGVTEESTTPTDTAPVDTPPTDTMPADTSAPENSGGCGAVMSLGIMACLLPAALIFNKKKHSK